MFTQFRSRILVTCIFDAADYACENHNKEWSRTSIWLELGQRVWSTPPPTLRGFLRATYMKRMVFHAKHYRIEVFGFCGDVWQCKINLLRLSPKRLWVPTIHTYSVPDERAEFRHEWVSLSLSPSGANAYSSRNHYTGHWECDLRTVLTYSEPLPRRFSYVVRLYQMQLVLVLQR